MIGEAKSFASLSAGLLARKGGARPAMRRQPLSALADQWERTISSGHGDDLGWNDMGYDVDPDPDPDPDQNSAEPTMDIKPILAASVMAAADAASGSELIRGDLIRGDAPVPEVVRQQTFLAERLAAQNSENKAIAAPQAPEAVEAPTKNPESVAVKAELSKAKAEKQAPAKTPTNRLRARDKAAFTLRLDPDQHLRLRLASAVSNQSSQMILIGLLDEYLASLPEISDLASRVPAVAAARITRSQ